jgi:hypothetical protein
LFLNVCKIKLQQNPCKQHPMGPVICVYPRQGVSWSWSCGSWIYNYLCNRCLSPLVLWVRIQLRRGVLGTSLCDQFCHLLAAGWWFSPSTLVSSTNKTDGHDITEILLKVALNTITLILYPRRVIFAMILCLRQAFKRALIFLIFFTAAVIFLIKTSKS